MTQSELYTYARRLVNATSSDWSEADLVVDLNDALSDIWSQMKVLNGTLEKDDRNYTDLPVAIFNLTANTSTYKVSDDENSNQITTIHKVAVLNSLSKWVDVPRERVGEGNQDGLLDDSTDVQEIPDLYYEIGTNIVFSPIPSTTRANGVKVWFDRAPKFFAVSGSLTPGIPVVYHKLIAEKAALTYAIAKGLNSANNIAQLITIGEARIDEYEGNKRMDEVIQLRPAPTEAK